MKYYKLMNLCMAHLHVNGEYVGTIFGLTHLNDYPVTPTHLIGQMALCRENVEVLVFTSAKLEYTHMSDNKVSADIHFKI
jgi:hypothetical protein